MTRLICTTCYSYACRCPQPEAAPKAAECPDTLMLFPTTPPSNGTDTSAAAAASLSPRVLNEQHKKVIRALWKVRPDGLTDHEIGLATGMEGSTVRPRRGECREAGWLEDSGERRQTGSGRAAKVWRITDKAVRAVEAQRNRRDAA